MLLINAKRDYSIRAELACDLIRQDDVVPTVGAGRGDPRLRHDNLRAAGDAVVDRQRVRMLIRCVIGQHVEIEAVQLDVADLQLSGDRLPIAAAVAEQHALFWVKSQRRAAGRAFLFHDVFHADIISLCCFP